MLVEAMSIERDFPINAMLNGYGGSRHSVLTTTKRDIFILERNLQISMRSLCKEEALPNELKVDNL
jgi:hypothetical protein